MFVVINHVRAVLVWSINEMPPPIRLVKLFCFHFTAEWLENKSFCNYRTLLFPTASAASFRIQMVLVWYSNKLQRELRRSALRLEFYKSLTLHSLGGLQHEKVGDARPLAWGNKSRIVISLRVFRTKRQNCWPSCLSGCTRRNNIKNAVISVLSGIF